MNTAAKRVKYAGDTSCLDPLDGFNGKYATDGEIVVNVDSMDVCRPRIVNGKPYYRLVKPDGKKCERSLHSLIHGIYTRDCKYTDIASRQDFKMEPVSKVASSEGVSQSALSRYIRTHGIPHMTRSEINSSRHNEAVSRLVGSTVETTSGHAEIIGVVSMSAKRYLLRCGKCGHVFERSTTTGGRVRCDRCEDEERELKSIANAKQLAFRLSLSTQNAKKANPDEMRTCLECGEKFRVGDIYKGVGHINTCCSSECADAYYKRKHKHQRRLKVRESCEDPTWRDLYNAGDHKCYLCGEPVDPSDYTHTESGAFIAGPRYPSLDHIVALANGGTHTLGNARLAHCRCNSMKGTTNLDEYLARGCLNGQPQEDQRDQAHEAA